MQKLQTPMISGFLLIALLAVFTCTKGEQQQEQISETILNKAKLSEEIAQKFGKLREGCFPRPSQAGCRCVEQDAEGHDLEKLFDTDGQCKIVSEQEQKEQINQTIASKSAVNEELKQKFANFREDCFPRPSKPGCRCVEKDAEGHDQEKLFDMDAECKVTTATRTVRAARVQQERVSGEPLPANRDRTQQKTGGVDPVAERARQNYAAVLNELKNKFAGLREGCYPRPKGCLCVIGKDATGREITERRMNDADCKCRPGERSRECPARGA